MWPRSAAASAASSPAGPAPTTATFRVRRSITGVSTSSVSWAARGFTRQLARFPSNTLSRQAWLQEMQATTCPARPSASLFGSCGSASSGRAIEIRSACPEASTCSATSGSWMRFEATTGTPTSSRRCWVCSAKAARGTEVTMVGTRASCQPIPVESTSTPARTRDCASAVVSVQVCPSGTRSSREMR